MEDVCVCCGAIIPDGRQVCPSCETFGTRNRNKYINFNCPECGMPLEVFADYLIAKSAARFDCFGYEKRELIRHCKNCHCDWVNEWETEFGNVGESQLRRKFWG